MFPLFKPSIACNPNLDPKERMNRGCAVRPQCCSLRSPRIPMKALSYLATSRSLLGADIQNGARRAICHHRDRQKTLLEPLTLTPLTHPASSPRCLHRLLTVNWPVHHQGALRGSLRRIVARSQQNDSVAPPKSSSRLVQMWCLGRRACHRKTLPP